MKNIIKTLIISSMSTLLFSCASPVAMGKWENTLEDVKGNSVKTTLTITETGDSFNAVMLTENIKGNIEIQQKKLELSGYVSEKILVIEDVKPSNEPFLRKSTLSVSDDGKTLVLSPSGLTFRKSN
ncbi:MAG: hypothetical protein ACK4IX_10245 [Candidatus Sericytochromatia bacterium]